MGKQAPQPQRRKYDDGIVRRSFGITVRSVNAEDRTVEVVASTTTQDSHGDIVEQDWNLDRYLRNPVVLWNHNRGADWGGDAEDALPIGHSIATSVQDEQLISTIKFGSAAYNEMSEKVFLGFTEGHIRAVSVGFYPGEIAEEKVDGGYRYRLSGCELLEISVVPIPSNPDAVARSAAAEHDQIGRLLSERRAKAQEKKKMSTRSAKPHVKKAMVTCPECGNEFETEKAIEDEENPPADSEESKAALALAEKAEATAQMLRAELESERNARRDAEAKLAKADEARTKTALDALEGKKFGKAEREQLEGWVKKLGLDEVLSNLEKRGDLAVSAEDLAGGIKTRGTTQPAPASTDPEQGGATVDADFSKAVSAQMNATA